MAITILELAMHRGLKTDDEGNASFEDFANVGLPMIGGCEACGACIAAYNACPSKTGYLRCNDDGCIGDLGYETVEEANEALFNNSAEEESGDFGDASYDDDENYYRD